MRLFLLITMLASAFELFAAEGLNLRNDREGDSYYDSKKTKRAVENLLTIFPESEIKAALANALKDIPEAKLCSFDVNQNIKASLNNSAVDYKAVVYSLRRQNEIDDVVVKILLSAHDMESLDVSFTDQEERSSFVSKDADTTTLLLNTVENFGKKYNKSVCFDEAYKTLFSEFIKADKKIKDFQIEALYQQALAEKKISWEIFQKLEQARRSEVQRWGLSLKDYHKKRRSLRNQYPLRDANETSQFVSQGVKKSKLSRRQRLLENYSDLQIILMANVVKTLRTRLDSQRMEILVYSKDETTTEVIAVNPMDRFCFCIVKLREEMAMLSLNSYFGGRSPDYIDLVTAAFEIGIIPASELDTVGAMEEIWNPKKKFFDKAKVWIQAVGSIATIVIPPPYGFIPALALVAIQSTSGNDDDDADPTRIFKCKN